MKLASMANYQKDGIIAVEYDTETETGNAYTIIDGVQEELPEGPLQHKAAGHLATEANYGGDIVSAQYVAVSGTGTASAVIDGVDIEIVGDAAEGGGLKSISISPVNTTDPALDTLFPIYWDDLTDDEKEDGVSVSCEMSSWNLFTVTVTPTSTWYIADADDMEFKEMGGSITSEERSITPYSPFEWQLFLSNGTTEESTTEYFLLTITINHSG